MTRWQVWPCAKLLVRRVGGRGVVILREREGSRVILAGPTGDEPLDDLRRRGYRHDDALVHCAVDQDEGEGEGEGEGEDEGEGEGEGLR